ncbi:cyclic nucleotide-binding domain-containing protein [Pseudomaricurvus alkylphenolicus]|uniref:cyclic nucleotide-binding domain-containing protein n=1 Tax=Pseudomaricurvus alkylphenolicus TaxID=1306991 RepID=UPI00141F3387|nr:cyclic nucleotide-binding domain-containing protein [Pseudomaricurvus alkylphenolicus]NIB43289.1 cyclic nucleotide-binding domain-containing protein [Pseudomaricurvus alkylphenolicus]
MSDSELIPQLTRFSPFDTFTEQYLQQVAEHAELTTAEKGELLFRRGKPAHHRYYLLEGRVDLVDANFETLTVDASDDRARTTLTDTSPTQVSAVAKSPLQLLKVEADFLDLAMAWSQSGGDIPMDTGPDALAAVEEIDFDAGNLSQMQVEVEESGGDWMSSLLSSSMFTRVPPAHIQQLFSRFEARVVKSGDVIVKEGGSGDYFYVIDRGRAKVSSISGVDVTLEAGSYFGEEALVADSPRNATVTMETDGLLMRLGKEDFTTLMHEPAQATISMEQYQAEADKYQLIDVRMPLEYRINHVSGSRNLPLARLRERMGELENGVAYAVTDDAGRRSQVAAYLMCQAGFEACILQGADKHHQ